MATSYSPKIITDGLVLCLDAADKKSLLAPPTTNLANNSNGTINWTTGNLVGTRTQSTVSANDYHYRFVLDKGSSSYISFRFAFDHTNLTNGETYIMSYKYKVTSGSGTFQVTDFCDVGVTRVTKDIGDGWYYETAYASRSSYDETYDFFDVQASDNMTVDIKEIQVEHTSASSPLATPFVSYQRQWKDRAGSNDGTPENMSDQSNFSSEGGGSLIFDGVGDRVECGSDSSVDIDPSGAITLAAWVNSDTITSNGHVIGKGAYGSGYILHYDASYESISGGGFQTTNVGNNQFEWGQNIEVGKWYYVVYTYDRTNEKGYYNGVLVATKANTGDISTNAGNNLAIGGRTGNNYDAWQGKIASVKIYNKALTASEVLQNYNATKGRFGL